MTKDEFTSLQLQYQQSGKSLKQFLSDTGICYSNYHYWDKKYKKVDAPKELAPIMFMKARTRESASANDMPIYYILDKSHKQWIGIKNGSCIFRMKLNSHIPTT